MVKNNLSRKSSKSVSFKSLNENDSENDKKSATEIDSFISSTLVSKVDELKRDLLDKMAIQEETLNNKLKAIEELLLSGKNTKKEMTKRNDNK